MLFMIVEHFRPGQAPAIYRRFRDRGRMMPEGVKYVSSWIDLDLRTCYQVMEAKQETDLKGWTAKWEDLMDFEIIPVQTSAEASERIAPQLLASIGAAVWVERASARPASREGS